MPHVKGQVALKLLRSVLNMFYSRCLASAYCQRQSEQRQGLPLWQRLPGSTLWPQQSSNFTQLCVINSHTTHTMALCMFTNNRLCLGPSMAKLL